MIALRHLLANTLLGCALLGCGALLLTACGGAQQQGGATGSGGKSVLIGEFGSMTGSEATFGQSTHKGIMLAVEEINAAGGVKGKSLDVKSYDDRGNSTEAGTAVTRLITEDKVVAVLGEVASSLSLAGAAVAQQFGVPMITPASTNPQVTQKGDMISRICFIDPYQGYVGAKFMHENLKLTKAAVLYDQTQAYSKGLKDDFIKAFKEMGGTLLTEQAYSGGDQDFNAQLTTIRGTNPEAIYLPGYYNDVANIIAQARRLGITVPFIGGDGWDSDKFTQIGGQAVEGCYYSNHYSPEDKRPEVVDFIAKFQKKYNEVPDAMAALGYDAARILADAMGRAANLEGETLAAAIAATKNYPGVTGKITLDANRNAEKLAVMLVIKNGKPSFVTTINPK
jgi:branched-chain amino acid transport system substrate-binding protein